MKTVFAGIFLVLLGLMITLFSRKTARAVMSFHQSAFKTRVLPSAVYYQAVHIFVGLIFIWQGTRLLWK